MKIFVILLVLAVLYCEAADDSKKEPASKENGDNGKTEAGAPSASTTASPPRARRSSPRFDANQMKGKYAKSNKSKRSLLSDLDLERTSRQERNIIDYLSPTPALLYAAQPPLQVKNHETTPSA